jgi:hypothetical protein
MRIDAMKANGGVYPLRHCPGGLSVQRLKARLKVARSPKPRRNAISVSDRSG